MTLFLTSSPCIYEHSPATLTEDNGFLQRIKAKLPKKPKTLFVASSPAEEDHPRTDFYAGDMAGAFVRAGIEMSGWQILDDLTAARARELVAWSDFIILMGGHVPTQNAFFRKIRLKHLLRHFNGVVMGISAGSMNMAEDVYVQPEAPGESDPDFQRFAPGLGLTWVNICPHFQKVRNMELDGLRLFEDITFQDSMGRCFFALPDNSYFYQDEEGLLLCGKAYRIKDGILELLTRDGQVLDMEVLQ